MRMCTSLCKVILCKQGSILSLVPFKNSVLSRALFLHPTSWIMFFNSLVSKKRYFVMISSFSIST